MSIRDDWRLPWQTRYEDRRESERARSDRSLPFIRPEDRDDHRRQIDESTGMPVSRGLAYAALAGAAAYVGLRHFSSGHLQKARRALGDAFEKATGGRGVDDLLERATRALGRKAQAGQPAARVMDKYLQEDLQTAFKIFSAESGYVGNRDAVVSALLDRYRSKNPLNTPLKDLPQEIRNLVNLTGFRNTAGRMGIQVEDIARQLGAAAGKQTHLTLGEGVRWALSARVPFLGWRPFELLAPTELLTRGPALSTLSKFNLPAPSQTDKVVSGLFANGNIYAVERIMVGQRQYSRIRNEALETGMQLGLSRSGMGKGAMARHGVSVARPLADILGDDTTLGRPLGQGEGLWDILSGKVGTEGILARLRRASLEIGERYGIGPQYSERRGTLQRALGAVRNLAVHQDVRINQLENIVPGATDPDRPIESWIRRKVGSARGRGAKELTWRDKALLRLGVEPKRTVARMEGANIVHEEQAIAEFLGRHGKNLRHQTSLNQRAWKSKYYAYKGVKQGLGDWFNYQLNRPTWLMNEMLGIGLKPGKNAAESMWNIGTRVVLPAYMGWQALQYAEYKSRKYFGYGPISGPAAVYTTGRAAVQDVLDYTGITDVAAKIEEQFPGAMESPFSKATAVVGGTAGGAALGRGVGGSKGAVLGTLLGAAAGLTFATGVTTPADELREMYAGERDVAVRANRWWFLGRQPFGGGRIKYWKKHWFAEMMTDYRDKAIYGSKREAWRGSWLPTPENLFLLKNIYDPYYVENRHYYDRPYPMTSPMFEEVPLVGPALSATLGRLIKPTRYRHTPPPDNHGLSYETLRGQEEAAVMGVPSIPLAQRPSTTKLTLRHLTIDTAHKLFDWTGLPGFMVKALTGAEDWGTTDPVLAASGMMTSSSRAYYEKNLGGMLGGTELLRRFMPKTQRKNWYNPLQNVAPEWLPGHRSVFPGDRAGYLNFHQGDPYTILEKGEGRLPGPGYEALHGLHSGEEGVYDSFDRFQILADVAPFSQAFKHYQREVKSDIEGGLLSKQDTDRYYQTLDNLAERTRSRAATGGRRYGSGAFATDKVRISRVLDPTTFQVHEMPGVTFKLAGVSDRTQAMSTSQFDAYQSLGTKMRGLVGQQIRMTWGGAGVETPAIVDKINQNAISAGLEESRLSDLGYRAKYGGGGLPALYESAIHTELPGPLNYPRVKWLGQRSAEEEYEFFYKHGGQSTNWASPFDNYVMPWVNQTFNREDSQAARARAITNYMDNLKYVKNTKLAMDAMQAGNTDLAQQYSRRASQTLVNLRASSPNFWRDIYAALPPVERPYFNVFAGATSEEEQEKILAAAPDHMKHIYVGLWQRKRPDHQFDSPILRRYAQASLDVARSDTSSRVAEFFASHPAPPKDWMGWHPGVDLDSVTIKTANQEGIDIHMLGMWESQQVAAEQFEDLEPIQIDGGPNWERRDNIMSGLDQMGFEPTSSATVADEEDEVQLRFLRRKSERLAAMQDRFSTAADAGGRFV